MSATTLSFFIELPLELQTMIWEMALETEDEHGSRLEHFCYDMCPTRAALGATSLLGREEISGVIRQPFLCAEGCVSVIEADRPLEVAERAEDCSAVSIFF